MALSGIAKTAKLDIPEMYFKRLHVTTRVDGGYMRCTFDWKESLSHPFLQGRVGLFQDMNESTPLNHTGFQIVLVNLLCSLGELIRICH
ncbi:hypothetical protein DM860_004572 [Cuscuta australis]|uniref:Uncharacterized protein n=1 Tax=Cuscuta australis TaxID=267555 RepID=A0A328EC81_9ASTE|nr:hypothetical protein DM860_004572 [Cuscuta australis]